MNSQYLVSIITPAYNCENFISETIDSVLAQTYTDWEMIIVDDRSTDNTEKIIIDYSKNDNRIRLIKLTENSGAAVARNIAIENANGRFIAFLDSDDMWKKDKLEVQLKFMRQNNYGFTFTGYEFIRERDSDTAKVFGVPASLNYSQALKNTVIGCLTVVIDKDIIGNFKMPLVRRGQDNLTWLMLLKRGHLAYGLNENLACYRRVTGSLSNNKIKALKRQWSNYRNVIKLPLFKCVYYYTFYVINNVKKYYFKNQLVNNEYKANYSFKKDLKDVARTVIQRKKRLFEIAKLYKSVNKFLKARVGHGSTRSPISAKPVNENQELRLMKKAFKKVKTFEGLKVAVLGLTFNPGIDDSRETPSMPNVKMLIEEGANVFAYDHSIEIENYKKMLIEMEDYCNEEVLADVAATVENKQNGSIKYVNNPEEALKNADLAFIFTELKEIKILPLNIYKQLMKNAVIFDGRNYYSNEEAMREKVEYFSIGRQDVV